MSNRVDVPPIITAEPYLGCSIVALSDVGCVREENQDFMGYARLPDAQVLVVADGMGGHSGGFEASRIVVSAVKQVCAQIADQPPLQLLEQSLRRAHDLVRQAAASDPNLTGMGSTAVIACIQNRQLWLGHVGDSRAYLIRDGQSRQLTVDHTRVNRMIEEGMITVEEAVEHPMGHILERSLGAVPGVLPDVQPAPLELLPGDRILLCSDGFTGRVSDNEIAALFSTANLEADARAALQLALDRQADDNTTIALIEVDGPRQTTPAPNSIAGRSPGRDLLYRIAPVSLSLVIMLLLGGFLYGFRAGLSEGVGAYLTNTEPGEAVHEAASPDSVEDAPMLGPDEFPVTAPAPPPGEDPSGQPLDRVRAKQHPMADSEQADSEPPPELAPKRDEAAEPEAGDAVTVDGKHTP
jgi:serine/threonine protein phosphatase PrpC